MRNGIPTDYMLVLFGNSLYHVEYILVVAVNASGS